jgi:outer membrane protein assembly factor BamB
MPTLVRALVVLLIGAGWGFADNWPGWRGPDGQGHSAEKNLPTTWSKTAQVRWRVPLPDRGNSTPIIWGDRVFITQAVEKGDGRALSASDKPPAPHSRSLLCLDRADGKLLWRRETIYTDKESTHATNPYCSASPVTDGERVIASYGSAGMVCYDFQGRELWRKDLGKLEHIWGNASSPFVYDSLAILWCGPGARQFLLAVDKATGRTVWEHNEPGGKFGQESRDWLGSWSTPIVVRVDGHDELILGVPEKLKGFDPRTGKELWFCAGLGKLVYTSAVCSADGIVVAMSGFHGPAMGVRAGGTGDVTSSHRLWRHSTKIPQRIGSAVIVGAHGYILNDDGTMHCFDIKTGNDIWVKERLSGGSSWGSMVAADGRLYVTNRTGETFVLTEGPNFELVAKNALGESVDASVAVSNGELFIRSHESLWCIGAAAR